MTDKEIIIGGVDVKKCKHFKALYESRSDGFGGITIENYCYLYEDNCEKHPQCLYRSNQLQQLETQLKRKEQELQAQRNFTTQEQRKIYCVAYDKTCETGNECKQKKCVFKDRLKYKQALDEIEEYLDAQQKYFDGEDYHNLLDIINKAKEQ